MSISRLPSTLRLAATFGVRSMSQAGEWGSGAGKGGGSGGAIRDAGGSFGKREVAQEEQYMRKLQAEQMKNLKESLSEEIDFHAKQIKSHKEAIDRHKKKISAIKHEEDKIDD